MPSLEAIVRWSGRVFGAVGVFLCLVWIRTLVGNAPPRPMPVDGLGAFWLGNGGVLFIAVALVLGAVQRAGQARAVAGPLAIGLALLGTHRIVSGSVAPAVRDWMGIFVVPEGVALIAVAGLLTWRLRRDPG